ncbi:hypothetical protein [Arenimonas fontis]|uniref:Uncharacterized protein n=1 Tax=Arenimonas fontis TaxID=2608255 RepID=A0A5B2Z729_9GAMM|nr:hypothetical protein [Arenimonas fontis]KAA2284578.1 hypothetical protein F0415_07695 [Arenimonas fontis]
MRGTAQGGGLWLRYERRPPWQLLPLGADLFTVPDEPTRRVRFSREGKGKIRALELLCPDGAGQHFLR